VLQKWRNVGQSSAVPVRISDCWGAPDDNCFTQLVRSVETGVQWVPCLDGKKEIPESFIHPGEPKGCASIQAAARLTDRRLRTRLERRPTLHGPLQPDCCSVSSSK